MSSRRALARALLLPALAAVGAAAAPRWAAAQRPGAATPAESAPAARQTSPLGRFADSVRQADSARKADSLRTSVPEEVQESLRPPACLQDSVLRADTALVRACARAYLGYYTYQARAYEHRSRTFEWQLLSTRITFAVVVLLVLAGMYFSWVQFQADLPGAPAPEEQVVEKTAERTDVATGATRTAGEGDAQRAVRERTVTHIKASAGGFEVSSPVLGVIILAMSLLFFYLYLKYVYPISETF